MKEATFVIEVSFNGVKTNGQRIYVRGFEFYEFEVNGFEFTCTPNLEDAERFNYSTVYILAKALHKQWGRSFNFYPYNPAFKSLME